MLALDASAIGYYFRGDPQAVPRLQAVPPSDLAVPAIVEYELRYGLARLPVKLAAPRQAALTRLLQATRRLPFDAECALAAARARAALDASGTPIGPHDILIAATALRHRATLVTRNVREFARVPNLQWVNWHDDP